MRSLLSIILAALIFLIPWISLTPNALAQSSTDEATSIDDSGSVNQADTELPSDIQTRESFAEETTEATGLGPTPAQYVKVFVALIFVIVVIYGLSLLMKRFVTVRGLASSSESLKILYTLSVSTTRTLYLVRLGGRILLIGAGEGGLRTLCEITSPEEVSSILRELEFKGNFELNPFKEKLSSLLRASDDTDEFIEDLDTRQRQIRSSLDRLKNASRSDTE